jgi:hypothetical protein
VSSGGWLAFEAFLQEDGTRVDVGVPIVSNVVRVGGSGGVGPGAAKASLRSMEPAREPTVRPAVTAGRTPTARSSLDTPSAAAGHSIGRGSSGGPGAESAAGEGRPKVRWLAGVLVGVLLLGGLVVGVTMILRPRTPIKRP